MGRITEELTVSFDIRMLILILSVAVAGIWGYRDLLDEIDAAKQLPAPGTGHYMVDESDPNAKKTWPATRIEYQMKDQASRNAIQLLEVRVEELEAKVKELRGE